MAHHEGQLAIRIDLFERRFVPPLLSLIMGAEIGRGGQEAVRRSGRSGA